MYFFNGEIMLMRKFARFWLIVFLILSMLNCKTLTTMNLGSYESPAIVVDPAIVRDPTMTYGASFIISIKICNVTKENTPAGLQGVEVHLAWNNSLIQPVSFANKIGQSGGVLNPSILYGINPGFYDANNNLISGPPYDDAVCYKVAAASTGDPWWSDGTVAVLEFKVVGVGKSALKFVFTDLIDADVTKVNHHVKDGCFDNRPAIPTAEVCIVPERITDPSLAPSKNFTVDVYIKNVEYLAAIHFNLSFNSSVLEIIETEWRWEAPSSKVNNELGILSGSVIIEPPFSGNTTLLTIQFHVKGIGESVLHLYDLQLMDMCNDSIPFWSRDGYFNNMLIPRIFVDPAYRMNPNLRPGDIVSFSIQCENLVEVIGVKFVLLYDSDVIRVIGYYINPVPFCLIDSEAIINNKMGTLHFSINYSQAVSLMHDPIVNITFQIISLGTSKLDLNQTLILDSLGNPVGHRSEDGELITVIRDVAVVEIKPTPQKVYPGRTVNIYIVVSNLGNVSESFTLNVYIDKNLLGKTEIVDLSPGENETVCFTWDTEGLLCCFWHSISANISVVSYENDVTNNFLELIRGVKIKMFGDIDGNGTVNLTDLILLAQSYNKKIGDPLYNPDADIDENGIVTLRDLVSVARYYNSGC